VSRVTTSFLRSLATAGLLLLVAGVDAAETPAALRVTPNLVGQIDRPLRYRPEAGAFVIEDGAEFFNRPLYGGNTAFRVDAGDRPEFSLYLPGRGGNLRLGIKTAAGAKWLHAAESVTARYVPGVMRYTVRDPLLGGGAALELEVLAFNTTEGVVVRAELTGGTTPLELIWAYGGVNGQRGKRDGDIGTEAVPIGEYFQLKPEQCRDNRFELGAGDFTLKSKPATIRGLAWPAGTFAVADGRQWGDPVALLATTDGAKPELPVVVGRMALTNGTPGYVALQRLADDTKPAGDLDTYAAVTAECSGEQRATPALSLLPAFNAADLPRVATETATYFEKLRTHVAIETPDAFINAAAAALNVAADAVWDEPQGAIMHGAIAWRTRLLGWRGPYALDALGWPERAAKHFSYWAGRQNLDAIPEKIPTADKKDNLARSETALHSNGDLSNSHYDMNLVYIDALFRHLQWTGDLEQARALWPVIERHLAWERRLFRREFGPDKLPLYEAYAAIWASDDLQYHGGGTAHASAYNFFHNTQAARLAKLLGKDGRAYEREAALIARGMREQLWLADRGTFAEFKDLLGRQLVHPSAALWSVYHTIDSELTTREEAWQMTRYVDAHLPHLPVRGPGVPGDANYAVLASSDWMPYTWSINNVVMGENVHTALAYWQAGRPEEAFQLTKSALLASMFMGICPGNVGSMNYLDVYRRESQRDFADGSGVLSRALVEGLFGVKPDALAGVLRFEPGLPAAWDHASLKHPQVNVAYHRTETVDTYVIEPRFGRAMELRCSLPAVCEYARVKVNGQNVETHRVTSQVAATRLEIVCPPAERSEITITWLGEVCCPPPEFPPALARAGALAAPSRPIGPFEMLDLSKVFNDRVTEIFRPMKYLSPRSPHVSLALPAQGVGAWAGHVNATAEIDDRGLRATAGANGGRFMLPNGVPLATPGPGEARNVLFTSQWDNYPREASVAVGGRARRVFLLMAGSTNWMQSRLDNGEVIVAYADGTTARLALRNPATWWPIDEDYFTDDYQFRIEGALPTRVDLRTGVVRVLNAATFKGRGGKVPGGAATVLELALDPEKTLQSLTVRALANEVVIGLMSATLERG
jgi:hypothetical protein